MSKGYFIKIILSKYDHAGTESVPTDFKEKVSHFYCVHTTNKTKIS